MKKSTDTNYGTSFIVTPGTKRPLSRFHTRIKRPLIDDETAKQQLSVLQKEIAQHQELIFAQNEYSVLIILQGMDTAGKDGLIEHVLKSVNPQGCVVSSFKRPSSTELAHDFLWRTHKALPARGIFGVFNRSYYEDVIVNYVHPENLQTTGLPQRIIRSTSLLKDRCEDIVNHESYLIRQGVIIIKIFLHLSKDEQKKRLIARLENPQKNWKFADADMHEREFWEDYQKAYNFCIERTSHKLAPWHIVPADDKVAARLIASQIIDQTIDNMQLSFPLVDNKRKRQLNQFKKLLEKS